MRRFVRASLLPLAIAVTIGAGALAATDGGQVASPLPLPPSGKTEVVDGKTYTRHDQGPVRLDAKDFALTHDGVTKHGTGMAHSPPVTWEPWDDSYPEQDWWMEGVAYILHRAELVGNPPVQVNYYRAGFELYSWRGDYDTIFGDEETVALNDWGIYLALVAHPYGGTLTTNKAGPLKFAASNPGNYTCQGLTGEVLIPADYNVVLRTNLVVRPTWKYWDSTEVAFRTVPYGQTRRMTHSFGLRADGFVDETVVEAYTNSWSGAVAIPGGTSNGPACASEVLQEP